MAVFSMSPLPPTPQLDFMGASSRRGRDDRLEVGIRGKGKRKENREGEEREGRVDFATLQKLARAPMTTNY